MNCQQTNLKPQTPGCIRNAYPLPTLFPPPLKNNPRLNPPNPIRKHRIQEEIRTDSSQHPGRARRLPAQIAVRVEGEARDGDGRVADEEADGGFGVGLREGVGRGEGC